MYRVTPPWEGLSKHFTKGFEAFALLLMREMPVAKVAQVVDETDMRLWRMLLAHVEKVGSGRAQGHIFNFHKRIYSRRDIDQRRRGPDRRGYRGATGVVNGEW